LGQFGLHAQARQRRLQLVRGVGQKVLLAADRLVQPRQQVVDGTHQRRHFVGNAAFVDWAQVRAVARADAPLQLVQRRDAACQRQPHQQHRQRQDHELRQDHALDDLVGQARTLAQRLGHLHQHHLAAGLALGPDAHIGDTHAFVLHLLVAEAQLPGGCWFVLGGQRQRAVAAQEFALRAQHLIEHRVGLVGAQQRGGFGRQRKARLAGGFRAVRLGRLGRHLQPQRARHLAQLAVIGLIGNALRHQPGQKHAHRPDQQQRREHPVQDLAEQGPLVGLGSHDSTRQPPPPPAARRKS
jgi:hypothetical protein